jgi:glyoxylate/hydroxypyruvate reductase A
MRPNFDILPEFPTLKAMFSRSAGVEAFVDHPRLPKAPLGKI